MGEKHHCARETSIGCLLKAPPTRDQTCNLGMYPNRESNPRHLALWDKAQPGQSPPLRSSLQLHERP